MNALSRPARSGLTALAAGAVLALGALPAAAQSGGDPAHPDSVFRVDPITVTVTRGPRPVFRTPKPVAVIDRARIQQTQANTVTDLFRTLPGLDVSGVGVNQARPTIRGQRGQRILLVEDGLRMNNARRQQDFGELPALVDVNSVERVEVVRGPASVLYGSDAIGGVVNIVTRRPENEGVDGTFGYRYGAAEDQNRWSGRLFGRQGRLSYHFGATLRSAGAYEAPAGTFGNITLSDETPVNNTGVDDRNFDLRLGLEIAPGQQLTARYEGYRAEDAGFGDVDPARYAQGLPEITILYPDQNVDKFTFGYEGLDLGWALADRLDARAFVVDNDRELTLNFFQSFGPQAPPGAGVSIENRNFTDITTAGFRAEARKAAGARALFTYGVDFSRDDSEGTDLSTTVVSGFGPPMETVVDRPQIPNATFRRLGVFVQSEIEFSDRFSVIAGGRFEDIRAETERTEGLEDPPVSRSDRTVVGSLNALFDVNDQVALVASIGRAFRSPNLIERFFNGPTPEGSGFQVRNPDLDAETSFNVDLGIRFRNRWVEAEAFGFRNKIFDGVRVRALGREEQGLPAFQNVNVDELLYRGVELAATVYPGAGLSVGGTFTHLDSEDVNDPENPVCDSFSNKLTGRVRYDDPSGRFWVQYDVRHNGDQKEVDLVDNPIGDVLPSFTVHDARAGVTLFRSDSGMTHRIAFAVTNLTNELYAEFSNAAFFRPEPKRNFVVNYEISF